MFGWVEFAKPENERREQRKYLRTYVRQMFFSIFADVDNIQRWSQCGLGLAMGPKAAAFAKYVRFVRTYVRTSSSALGALGPCPNLRTYVRRYVRTRLRTQLNPAGAFSGPMLPPEMLSPEHGIGRLPGSGPKQTWTCTGQLAYFLRTWLQRRAWMDL